MSVENIGQDLEVIISLSRQSIETAASGSHARAVAAERIAALYVTISTLAGGGIKELIEELRTGMGTASVQDGLSCLDTATEKMYGMDANADATQAICAAFYRAKGFENHRSPSTGGLRAALTAQRLSADQLVEAQTLLTTVADMLQTCVQTTGRIEGIVTAASAHTNDGISKIRDYANAIGVKQPLDPSANHTSITTAA